MLTNTDEKIASVSVTGVISPIVSSRDVVHLLKDAIKQTKSRQVALDFSGVDFVSRSAAHELLMLKEDLSRDDTDRKELSFRDMNEDVKKMMRVVAANRAAPRESVDVLEVERVSADVFLEHV